MNMVCNELSARNGSVMNVVCH